LRCGSVPPDESKSNVARTSSFVRVFERFMMIWWLLLVVGIWLLLQLYILPKMGVST
jgi:hypothetical protein